MKITFRQEANQIHHTIIPVYINELEIAYQYAEVNKLIGFNSELGESMSLQLNDKKIHIICIGVRSNKENLVNHFRKAIVNIVKIEGKLDIIVSHLEQNHLFDAILGTKLSTYAIDKFKTKKAEIRMKEVNIVSNDKKAISVFNKANQQGEAMMNVMDLVNLPSNIKTPYYMADYAIASGKANGYKVKVFRDTALVKQNLHAVYAVGKGSANPPAFIIMEYTPKAVKKGSKTIGLVGKGISFDTGGISIKPSTNMHYMKCDMAGAAAIIGTMEAAAKMQSPHKIIGIIPAAENAVSSTAYRPGDIIDTYSGKTIEVIDTDAEGRVVLADGLSYLVKNYKTDYLIDLATLTGSCVATLGYFAAGLFSKNEALKSQLYTAGMKVQERVWPLPMWDDYKNYMSSDMADIKNLSGTPVAGAITAAKFLEEFTENHSAYAHLDIAGVVFNDSDIFKTRTATGYGVRLLCEFIENL